MIQSCDEAVRWLLKATLLGAIWAILFHFNAYVFKSFALSDHASWIFLPASLRVLMPLVYRSCGIAGLVLGSLLVTPPTSDHVVAPLLFAVASGLAPVVGIAICKRIFQLPADLAGLAPVHLAALSLLCGASNSLFVHLCLLLTDAPHRSALSVATIFVGDVAGTAIVLYGLSAVLALLTPSLRQKD